MCPDSWVVSWNFCSRLQLAAKSSRLVGRWLQMIYETTTKLCLRLWVHKCERGSWTKSANVINDEPAIVSQVWKCQACTLVLNHQCWPVTQMSIIHHWRHWPAVELLHSSLTESVSLPNAVHLRLDTAISTDSCNTTQTHQCIQQLSVYSLTILSNENDDNDNNHNDKPQPQLHSANWRTCVRVVRQTYSNFGNWRLVAAGAKLRNSLQAGLRQMDISCKQFK